MSKVALCIILLIALTAATKFNLIKSLLSKKQPKLTNRNWELSMFYCGFGDQYCGQSSTNDINKDTKYVILAFLKTNTNGSVTIDVDNFPSSYKNWKNQNKKVLISVGGQNGNWKAILSSQANTKNFIDSVKDIINKFQFDGVDLDIESYESTPRTMANMIVGLRKAIGITKIIMVSPECVTVYQGYKDYSPDQAGHPFNYMVNIIRLADDAITLYQPQAYNNWYDFPPGSLNYLKDVYLNWRNYKGMMDWMKPISDFNGVSGDKLMMGVLASTKAGSYSYYYTPSVLAEFKNWLIDNKYSMRGFMVWDSHWDDLNQKVISTEVKK